MGCHCPRGADGGESDGARGRRRQETAPRRLQGCRRRHVETLPERDLAAEARVLPPWLPQPFPRENSKIGSESSQSKYVPSQSTLNKQMYFWGSRVLAREAPGFGLYDVILVFI